MDTSFEFVEASSWVVQLPVLLVLVLVVEDIRNLRRMNSLDCVRGKQQVVRQNQRLIEHDRDWVSLVDCNHIEWVDRL